MLRSKNGSVLIFAIWTLSLLVVFASYVGLRIRQRAEVIARLEERSLLRNLVEAGVKRSISIIKNDVMKNGIEPCLERKQGLLNNPVRFGKKELANGYFEIERVDYNLSGEPLINGLDDEEAKINLNLSDWTVIKRLFQNVLVLKDAEATTLADAVVSWRDIGDANIKGFYSDEYYKRLQNPYEVKHAEFESLDELLLLEGMTPEAYEKILPFVTIYGSGQVNFNTASRTVFLALGMDGVLVDKILQARRGVDGKEYTRDDVIFTRAFDLASDVKKTVELTKEEIKQIDDLNALQALSVNSLVYRINVKAILPKKNKTLNVSCIYNALEGNIDYWNEK
ncbi:MAG: general secretion pathway protein GspK [Candidatus Omnitrophica bacterium]|nr:general secretion pathway protein GspK [Candidatus Omnitrophota bacterium]